MFLWYDEENDNFVELDTVLDEENSTVSVETTHFSKYMLVDQTEWFKAWKNASLYFEDTYEPLATVICYDCSGSMSSNDRTFNYNIFNDDGTIAYSYPTCYRKLAIDSFIDSMMLTDKTALVSFESSAKLVSGFSSDNDVLKSLVKPYNGGGTNARAALDIAISQLETVEHWYSRHVILLSDGDVNVTANQILQAKTAGIKIHTIGLGSGANNQILQNCARDTGGQFFAAKTAEELDAIYRDLSKDNHFDLEGLPDEDDDGLPDEFEVSGLVISNAQVIYTDPENPDCDDDDLLDGQEISIDGAKSKTVKIGSADGGYITYSTVVFKYSSDPWDEDTDDDGLTDKLEKEKKSNPLNPDSDNDCIPDGIDEDPMCYTTGKNYFFVYDNEGSDFISQADWMSKYAYDDENVEFIYVTKIDEFIEEWNNPEFKYANTIHLYMHGDMGSLYFLEETMTYEDMDKLNNKYVQNKVYLYSCNGGTEFESTTVAWKISERIYGKYVEALRDDFVDYFTIAHPFTKLPIMHNGNGKWCYFYSIKQSDNIYKYYEEEIGDEWTL